MKQILGIILVIVGVVMLFVSNHIKNEVAAGRLQIIQGQRTVNQVNTLFSARPETQAVGKQVTGGAQRRIDEGQGQVDYYTNLANQLQMGGIVLIIVGAGLFVWGLVKRHHHHQG